MTKEDTWAALVGLGVVEGKSIKARWALREADLSGAYLHGAYLSGAYLHLMRVCTIRDATAKPRSIPGI